MARTKTTSHPAPTVVLLVRHGQTPTTGKLLPGRAPGLHLADVGHEQAQRAAERIAALASRSTPSTPRRSNEPAKLPHPSPPPAA
jgi:broad specificity phosphatase PhoE